VIHFIFTIKLDKKKRLVLPLKIRNYLEITDSIAIKKTNKGILIEKPKQPKGIRISKNHFEKY